MPLSKKTRIVILGGGFGGANTARHLERLCKRRRDVEIVLVSRDNFLLMTPLLFEVCSGALDARHCSFPIRAFLRTTRFVEATVHVIERFERADVEPDPARKRRQLTFVIIGGGLVGVELFGELTAFADGIAPLYQHVERDEVRFILLQRGGRLMPEIDPT